MTDQAVAIIQPTVIDQERVKLLSNYHAQDHLAKWVAYDKRQNKNIEVVYYPAAWRLYELSLRYGDANFSCDIFFMDAEKDFVIVKARLYLGASYDASPKKAEAYKQGRLTELDRVETKAKARAARDFGIGTEHALDMDDLEAGSVEANPEAIDAKVRVVSADKSHSANGTSDLPTMATPAQQASIGNLCRIMNKPRPGNLDKITFEEAKELIVELGKEKKTAASAGGK